MPITPTSKTPVALLALLAVGCPGGGTTTATETAPGTTGDPTTTPDIPTTSGSATTPGTTGSTTAPGTSTSDPVTGSTADVTATGSTGSTGSTTGTSDDTDTTASATAGTDTTAGATGTTADTDATGTSGGDSGDIPPGTLDCDEFDVAEPIVLEDTFTVYSHDFGPTPMVWQDDLLLARETPGTDPACTITWEYRDQFGALIGEPTHIPLPFASNQTLCRRVADVAWDPGHQRYIYLHPAGGVNFYFHTPMAITPTGEIAWMNTSNDERRFSGTSHGMVSNIRVVGDEVIVMGYQANPAAASHWVAVHVYDTATGTLKRTLLDGDGKYDVVLECDASCSTGLAYYNGLPLGPTFRRFDLTTATYSGPAMLADSANLEYPVALRPQGNGTYFIAALQRIWQENNTYLFAGPVLPSGQWDRKATIETSGVLQNLDFVGVDTDGGHVLATTAYTTTFEGNWRLLKVLLWNLAPDGTVRSRKVLEASGHSPRMVRKGGKIAVTWVKMQAASNLVESRKLSFLTCPP
ncbi:hypothetical protein [Nannocystis radixulma]|uniref:Uncharacterized protein n=1 Tax=Nannocystis radixulma TaxID=2995305 RepID=A0ABT5BFU8_9BACT|nr:hypothetical protein [Nannocystis radixulma]MDC0672490.1 hypothetical protein [Nannocystis radixulma]